MNPTPRETGSTLGALIGVVCVVAIVVFAGLWLRDARDEYEGTIDRLRAELTTAQTRSEELQATLNAESAARERAEVTAKEAGSAAERAREELQSRQVELGKRIQELVAGIQDYEQQLTAAKAVSAKAETDLAAQIEQRTAVEQEISEIKGRLQQQELLVSQQPRTPGTPPETAAGTGASSATPQNVAGENLAGANLSFDTPPRPVDLVSPEYPDALRQNGTDGHVVVSFMVNTQGRVGDVDVRESTHREFETAAVAAVRKWRFKPALRDGEPVEVRISQRLEFSHSS